MADITHWLKLSSVIWIFICSVSSETVSTNFQSSSAPQGERSNCYAEAVYDELLKVIDIVKAHTYSETESTDRKAPQSLQKKFQEDEDYGGIELGGLPVGGTFEGGLSLVPTIFKLVGSAITLNSSGLTEGSFGLLPERVSNQITNVLGTLATSILGPGVVTQTTTRPVRRRRRTTTTTMATTSEAAKNISALPSLLSSNTTDENSTLNSDLINDLDSLNETDIAIEDGPTTTEVLFKESSLGENPVYAAAYAPNYVATTTFPVYANSFLHVLYAAPTTTTVATTTTASTTSTTTDPNSYNIPLPFDYMEGIGIGTDPATTGMGNLVDINIPPNVTNVPPSVQYTPSEYTDYEYEEQTEEAKEEKYRDKNVPESLAS